MAALGETVLLWIRQDDSFVLAAAREGTQPLRYVPTPGLRLRADATRLAGLATVADDQPPAVEEELLPGIWTVASALPTASSERACIALAGPRERLSSPEAGALLAGRLIGPDAADGVADASIRRFPAPRSPTARGRVSAAPPPARSTATSSTTSSGQSLVATLSYLADDGYPATVPLWYAWDGASFWLASRPGSEWAEHVRLDPRVSLAVSESTPPLRRVLARGRLVEVDDPGRRALGRDRSAAGGALRRLRRRPRASRRRSWPTPRADAGAADRLARPAPLPETAARARASERRTWRHLG